jgi:ribosome-binding protein aMBF1 (putative translation factor)
MKKRERKIVDAVEIMDAEFGKQAGWRDGVAAAGQRRVLGDLVRDAREAQGMTQTELARRAKTTQSAVSRLEDADYETMKLDTLERVAAALGLPLSISLGKATFEIRPHARSRR